MEQLIYNARKGINDFYRLSNHNYFYVRDSQLYLCNGLERITFLEPNSERLFEIKNLLAETPFLEYNLIFQPNEVLEITKDKKWVAKP